MITEDYVSFEVAKLLKEKGFNELTPLSYSLPYGHESHIPCCNGLDTDFVSRITLQMAMKWFREVHNFHIWVEPNNDKEGLYNAHVKVGWWSNNWAGIGYNTYEEACEAAIKYCLKNLIKNEDKEEESDIPVPKTVNEAISTLEKILSDEDREYLLKNGAISMHDSLGRWIRNEWGLWTGSELKDEMMNMNKGLNHPDDMSNYIIEEFIKYWNNKI